MKAFFFGFSYHFCLYVMLSFYGIILFLLRFAPWRFREWVMNYGHKFSSKMLVFAAGVKLTHSGRENLYKMDDQSYILICNHVTTIDPAVILTGIGRYHPKFVYSSRAAVGTPIVGRYASFSFDNAGWISIKPNPNDSDNPASMRKIVRAVDNLKKQMGKAQILIFPEGIRTEDGTVGDFHVGAFFLSIMLQMPIIPIRTKGVYDVHKHKTFLVNPGPVQVDILKPMFPPTYDKKSLRHESQKMCDQAQALYEAS